MRGLKDHRILVTGATGLIGRAVTERFQKEGAHVFAASRSPQKASGLATKIGSEGGPTVKGVGLDLSMSINIAHLVSELDTKNKLPHTIICCASNREAIRNDDSRSVRNRLRELMDVDVTGHIELVRLSANAFLSPLKSVVWLSSIYALAGADSTIYEDTNVRPSPVQYAAAKAAVLGAVRSLAATYAPHVRVNAIVAGGVRDEQTDRFVEAYSRKTLLGRMAKSAEIASIVAFLASDDASYITGAYITADGGFLAQ